MSSFIFTSSEEEATTADDREETHNPNTTEA